MSDVIGGVKVYPFHLPYPGTPALFHVACPEHSEFGFCGTESEARTERSHHLHYDHRPGLCDCGDPCGWEAS